MSSRTLPRSGNDGNSSQNVTIESTYRAAAHRIVQQPATQGVAVDPRTARRNMRHAGLSVAELLQCLRNQLRPRCPSAAPWAVANCGEHLLQLIDNSLAGDRALDEVQQRLSGVFADHRILRIGRRRSYSARCSLSASLMAESSAGVTWPMRRRSRCVAMDLTCSA